MLTGHHIDTRQTVMPRGIPHQTIPHLNSLSPSVANTPTTGEIMALLIAKTIAKVFKSLFLRVFFLKISKFALPGIMCRFV